MKKYKIGDLVKRRGIETNSPILGVVIGWDNILELALVKWNQPTTWEYEDIGIASEHPEMLEIVCSPKKLLNISLPAPSN